MTSTEKAETETDFTALITGMKTIIAKHREVMADTTTFVLSELADASGYLGIWDGQFLVLIEKLINNESVALRDTGTAITVLSSLMLDQLAIPLS